jgi:hypothetical protein
MFGNMVVTDEFSASFVCCQSKRPPPSNNPRVPLEDFTLDEVKQDYKPFFVDPGRTHAFTAVSGFESSNVEVRRCSTTEYYTMMGSIAYLKKLNQKKSEEGITAIESRISTAKTASY